MKYTSLLAILAISLLSTFITAQSTITETIYFDSDQYSLTTASKQSLQVFAAELQTFTEYNVVVNGHTDQDGSEEYNMQLSQNRAASVRRFLSAQGVSDENMSVQYYGESAPVQQADSDIPKGENRRVTLQAIGYKYTNIEELVSQLLPDQLQRHTVSQLGESNITLAQGTEVTVPAAAFCHLDGSPVNAADVLLTCQEAFSYSEMVDQRLFTQTHDQMLETGGMIYVEASLNGEPLRLQDGKSIELKLPEQGTVDGMEVFEGIEDSTGTIWAETGTEVKIEKEELFVQIDLSSLFEYVFEDTTNIDLTMSEMPDYPRPLRIAYAPNKNSYSEEQYKEAYRKYEEVMEAHENDKVDLPERQLAWHKEADRRTELLYAHKKKFIRAKVITKLQEAIAQMPAVAETVSHHKLVGSLNGILDNRVEKIPYDEQFYKTMVFRGAMTDIKKLKPIRFPNYQYTRGLHVLPEFYEVVSALNQEIKEIVWIKNAPARAKKDSLRAIAKAKYDAKLQKKFEEGYVDQSVVGRYVLSTSNLGWINCDRFLDLEEYEMTELEFARASKDETYYLVFKNIKSLLRPKSGYSKVSFLNIPKGEDVRLVSIYYENGKAKMAYQDFVIGADELTNFNYQDVGVPKLREVFEQM